MGDPVNHPAHYSLGGVEVIDAIEAWDLGLHLGNVVKYCARAGKKDPAKTLEDLKKARWYLDRYIGLLERQGGETENSPRAGGHLQSGASPGPDTDPVTSEFARLVDDAMRVARETAARVEKCKSGECTCFRDPSEAETVVATPTRCGHTFAREGGDVEHCARTDRHTMHESEDGFMWMVAADLVGQVRSEGVRW